VTAATEAAFRETVGRSDVLLAWHFPLAVLAEAATLRWLHVLSAGVDHLGDLRAIDERIVITSSKGMHGDIIADYVLAMVLAHAWRLREVYRNQEQRVWRQRPAGPLAGRVAAIIGLGHVGREVARRLRDVGMVVIGTRRGPEPVPAVETVYPPKALHDVLRRAQTVVLTVPLTEETRGLIAERELRTMQRSAQLINVSRGAVVDYAALARALREGWLAEAVADVFPVEPLPSEHELWAVPNLVLTPHVSGERSDYVERAAEIVAENLECFLATRPLVNLVDRKKGY
jgi:phosphoglycerate dehydrogenase-like enzyme